MEIGLANVVLGCKGDEEDVEAMKIWLTAALERNVRGGLVMLVVVEALLLIQLFSCEFLDDPCCWP